MLAYILPWVAAFLLVLGATHHTTAAQQPNSYTESSTMGSSLVVNQLAILRMLEDSSNSCSAVPPNFLEKLQAQLQQDKQEFHGTITDFLLQMVALKNDTIADVQKMSEVMTAINSTREDTATVEEKVVDLQTHLHDTQTRLDDTQTHLDNTQTLLQDTQTRLNDTQTRLHDTHTRLNDIHSHLSNTQTGLDDTQAKVSVLESAVSSTQADLRSSQAKLLQLETDREEVKEALRSLPSVYQTVSSSRSSIDVLTTRLNALQDKVQENSADLADYGAEVLISLCAGHQVLRRLAGVLSVSLSRNYVDGMDCSWEVVVPPGSMLSLTWTYFGLEDNNECGYDYVMLEDMTQSNQLLYGRKLCGSTLPEPLEVASHHLKITFHSDGSNVFEGFMIKYKAVQ